MNCGHSCESYCHLVKSTAEDPSGHDCIKCYKQCVRERDCGHKCPEVCFECKHKHKNCLI